MYPVLSKMFSGYTPHTTFFMYILILSFHLPLCLPSGFFLLYIMHKIRYAFNKAPMNATYFAHLIYHNSLKIV
jgi:hypothetical protein